MLPIWLPMKSVDLQPNVLIGARPNRFLALSTKESVTNLFGESYDFVETNCMALPPLLLSLPGSSCLMMHHGCSRGVAVM